MKKLVALSILALVLATGCNLLFGPNQMVATPAITLVDNGEGRQYVEITCATPGARIYYALGSSAYVSGVRPNMSYYGMMSASSVISGSSARVVYAVAKKDGMTDSVVTSKRIEKLSKPTITYNYTLNKFEIRSGDYQYRYVVYTTNGTTPSMTNGTRSSTGYITIPANGIHTVKAVEISSDPTYQLDSDVTTYNR